jgi:transposase
MVAELIKVAQTMGARHPRLGGSTAGRPPQLSLEEAIALALFRYALNIKDVKHFWWHLHSHYTGWFHLPNYGNFIGQINRGSVYALILLQTVMRVHRQQRKEGPLFVDTSALKVCENARISEHKVCKQWARRGKTSYGWFYGFKLGLLVDKEGHLLSVALRPGNTDDRKFLAALLRGIRGMAIADAGFLSKDWVAALWKQGLWFLTDVKKPMKKLMTWWQHELLKMRQHVEIRLGMIKYRIQQAVSLARSMGGYIARWIYALLAYSLFPALEPAQ